MRLEKIRLAGFKSFVDPTTVLFPGNLVGVVGPNGCGKSNVIDAVRWVMGESSAKMLRGESMADVIFNGSTGRKPVGTASIELVFDNADGGAGGAYAAFNQISVKRQVSRDGQSAYSLNGTRCRRRDIQDLFLGTGLGPRSYAIIEQGMISRIIEARPEDLRIFLEEAAGISKYKERRRETESRMRQTRENLDRLDDLRDEVNKQIQHLERQAASAERYTQLKAEERRLDLELKALRWQALDEEIRTREQRLAETETRTEAGLAQQRRIEADIEARRADYQSASETFNGVQGRFYAVGSEIARAEQAIQFANEARGRREGELVRLDQEIGEAEDHLERDRGRLAEIDRNLARDEPELAGADQALSAAVLSVAGAEDRLKQWERLWDDFSREAAGPSEQAQAERARINALEQRSDRDRDRLRRLDEDLARLQGLELEGRFVQLVERESRLETALADMEERHEAYGADLAERDGAIGTLASQIDRVRTLLQQSRGRLASLVALQDEALADTDDGRSDWLAAAGLADASRLIDRIEVDSDWQRAVEVLLGDAVRAIGIPNLDRALAGGDPPPGLVLLETREAAEGRSEGQADAARDSDGGPTARAILAHVRAPWALDGLLGRVRTVDRLADAVAMRDALGSAEQWVTPEGAQVGRDWLSTPPVQAQGGVIARAEAIKALGAEIADHQVRESELCAEQERLRTARTRAQEERADAGRQLSALGRELAQLKAELASLRAKREHRQDRLQALGAERDELQEQMADALEEMEEARERLHAHLSLVETLAERREAMQAEREVLRSGLAAARDEERGCRERTQGLRVSVGSNRAARAATQQSLARIQERRSVLHERRAELLDALEESVEPLAEQRARLDEQLVLRVEVEQALAAARNRLEALDGEVRELEQARQRLEQESRLGRGELDRQRLEQQERLVRRQTLAEQIAEAGQTPLDVLAATDPAANESQWQEALAKTGARLQRLGPVNLAAVDEFRQQAERKVYLDAQHEDISRSLETLEQAIRKIDRETRNRFRETYDQVNQGFQLLFPRLFGGGHASLDLTDEDLLETGVTVMARPPGKRNSSIHLLSGGEKALTAVALVFAIFELNPAPFCMLDEVDAPLDDANVGRFCEQVRSMSDRVQFVFISHNKVTMEIADHLLGVTMHEPGVSRLVSVDVEEAVRLAAVS
ncbi:chromosome segregation protein SMC [Thiocapsa roseopersicina]|uniref:Chromosome partition protein Smc n=1 Tax=Thiocapsa roseopersicina TaxID=1058 RepID=A0A1H2Q5R8_THIRO|nr:chromosome segregation protein SMC [Thiocapsa roseopersicina]SDW02496.1 condensin subunit Smc [Thiocapsa roseopersicina]